MAHTRDLATLEAAISSRSRDFEVSALLDLLASIGYGPSDVEFRGHLARRPQPSLIHAVTFPDRHGHSEARVVICVNLGLLSCRSPLPTYFGRFFSDIDSHDAIHELLDTLDRSLLHTRLTSDHPARTLATWAQTQRDLLRVFGLDAPIGLSWLFRRVFPELGVELRRSKDDYTVPFAGARLGLSELGSCSFGDRTHIGVHDMEVSLICEGAQYDETTPWIAEGNRRLREVVFPRLDEVCMTLTVVFVLMDRRTAAHLSPHSYAGYDPMWPLEVDETIPDPPSRVELYRGALPRLEPDMDELEHGLAQAPRRCISVPAGGHRTPLAGSVGCALELPLVYEVAGRRHRYVATVRWSARAWYRDEPHAIELSCDGVKKTRPKLDEHPRLWVLLRDEARARIADRLTHAALATVESDRVTLELIERLIDVGGAETLHALSWSASAPMDLWDDEAWQRFASWSARGTPPLGSHA